MKRSILSISVALLSVCGFAMPSASSVPDAAADSLSARQFDAFEYSMQKRWRPADAVPFGNGKGSDHLFIGVSGSAYVPLYGGYSYGPHFSAHIGKWFNPYNALRVAPGVGYYFNNSTGARIKQLDVKASYLFNLMAYLGGYRPSRFMEISTVAGLGYTYSWYGRYSGHSLTAHAGLHFDMHVTKNVHLYVEPLVELSVDGLGQPGSAVQNRLTPYLCGNIGLSYRFGNDSRDYVPDGNWFLYVAGGTHLQTSANVLHNMSVSDAFGFDGALGVGRRYWNCFALRLSIAYSRNNWDTTLAGEGIKAQYAAGRLEAMLDLVALIGGKDDNRFCLSIMFGPEAGIMFKDNMPRRMNPYVGMTGGLQAKTRLSSRVALFVEPRMSYVPYPGATGKRYPVNRNFHDGLLDCNVGVEIAL